MSGHSHYATIKRQKETKDAAKGRIFSRLSKTIAIAVKAGGGITDPNSNYKLRIAVETARSANMPKSNINRAISSASTVGNLEEVSYEGYGPSGIAVIVDAVTDNKNRTAQEIKNIFERGGGNLAGPGSVAFNFEPKALYVLKKQNDAETQILKLIDLGVEDIEEGAEELEVYSNSNTSELRDVLEKQGFEVISFNLVRKPKNMVDVTKPDEVKKAISFLDNIENQEDVQNVYTNLNVPDNLSINNS